MLRDTKDKLVEELREDRRPIVEQCTFHLENKKDERKRPIPGEFVRVDEGCDHIECIKVPADDDGENLKEVEVCKIWWKPSVKFRPGFTCNTATHRKVDVKKAQQGKRRVGQQKQRSW